MSWKNKNLEKLAKKEKILKKRQIKSNEKLNKKDFTILNEKDWESYLAKGYFIARVVEVQKKYVFLAPEPEELEIETTDVWLATIAKKFLQNVRTQRNFIVVGDRVLCKPSDQKRSEDFPQCTIEFRAPRVTEISRVDPLLSNREHVLACNITQIVIVASYLNPNVRWGLIDRFLVEAEHEKVKPSIILNKSDLLKSEFSSEEFRQECKEYEKLYKDLGYNILSFDALKAKTNKKERAKLSDLFDNEMSLMVGHSGVGKSSITNLLGPEIEQDVEEEEISRRGRHTTTYTSLIKLEKGGFIIDSPGIKSFILQELDPFSLSWGFVEMRPYINACRYRKCKHHVEPGCKVKEALDEGKISPRRYQSYLSLLLDESGREGRLNQK